MFLNRNPFGYNVDYGRHQPTTVDLPEESVNYMNEVLDRMRRDAFTRTALDDDEDDSVTLLDDIKFPSEPIRVDACEFHAEDNAKSHHTELYELLNGKKPSAIFRRGLPVTLTIRFNRPFSMAQDKVNLELILGPKKVTGRGNFILLRISPKKRFTRHTSKWDIRLINQEESTLHLQIQIPYTASVGFWTMNIISGVYGKSELKGYNCHENIYILFNPWSEEDPVYMEDDSGRQEYVLDDVGKLYNGVHKNPGGRPWVFGQFEPAALTATAYLLEKSGLDFLSRGNPLKVCRAMSAMVNSFNGGVVAGNWSGNYKGGIPPTDWTGSIDILKQYLKNRGEEVKWGQCWVYSGVFTTVSRTLGIPCRSVTTFDSAVETDDNLKVDFYFDDDGKELDHLITDKIWNFHVWNECWMTRPDLPEGYGGWQAFDGNPRAYTEVPFRSGPTSVLAIKRKEFKHPYDTKFTYAQVEADLVHWLVKKGDRYGAKKKKLKEDTTRVGTLVATKKKGLFQSSGSKDMEDITSTYKSKEVRDDSMTAFNAEDHVCLGDDGSVFDSNDSSCDVSFELRDIDKIRIGKNFKVIVEMENKSNEKRTVTVVLSANTIYYTGDTAKKIKRIKETIVLKPQQKKEFNIEVIADDYLSKLVDYSIVKMRALCMVEETEQTWMGEDVFQFITPSLKMDIKGQLRMEQNFHLKVSFTNPLKRTLKDCYLKIEGPGIIEPSRKIPLPDVGPEETMTHTENLKPKKEGSRKIIAAFWSRELHELFGLITVIVE